MDPSHRGVVAIAAETATITETTDGVTPHTMPAIPATPTLIGILNSMPEASPRLNNRKGFGVGAAGALHDLKGSPRPQVTFDLKIASTGFLSTYCMRDSNDKLPYFCIFAGVSGDWTDVYRFCKVNEVAFTLGEPGEDGAPGEVTARITAFGLERQYHDTPLVRNEANLRALGMPLLWGDVRGFDVDISGTPTPLRNTLTGLTATLNHNLKYAGGREDFGDNNLLSRGAYEILEGHKTARAEISLNKRLTRALFNAAVDSQEWGDIEVPIFDVAQTIACNLTLENAIVADEVARGVQSSERQSYTVPVELEDLVIDNTPPV